jgi:hypothetical protein
MSDFDYIWARIVNNEIMEIWDPVDGDPRTHWHPDTHDTWQQVPAQCHVGWKFKNNNWISGSQWLDEFKAENPLPPPGPPTAYVNHSVVIDNVANVAKVNIHGQPTGIFDRWHVVVDGKEYTSLPIDFVYALGDVETKIDFSMTVDGPGGTHVHIPEDDFELVLPPKWIPPIIAHMNEQNGVPKGTAPATLVSVTVTPMHIAPQDPAAANGVPEPGTHTAVNPTEPVHGPA